MERWQVVHTQTAHHRTATCNEEQATDKIAIPLTVSCPSSRNPQTPHSVMVSTESDERKRKYRFGASARPELRCMLVAALCVALLVAAPLAPMGLLSKRIPEMRNGAVSPASSTGRHEKWWTTACGF